MHLLRDCDILLQGLVVLEGGVGSGRGTMLWWMTVKKGTRSQAVKCVVKIQP